MIENPIHLELSRPVADGKPNGDGSQHLTRAGGTKGSRQIGKLVIVGVISLIAILSFIPGSIQKWLWMRQR
jgi:hypothetical protein